MKKAFTELEQQKRSSVCPLAMKTERSLAGFSQYEALKIVIYYGGVCDILNYYNTLV